MAWAVYNTNFIIPHYTSFYKPLSSYEGLGENQLSQMQKDYKNLVRYGDYEKQRKYWDLRTPHDKAPKRGTYRPGVDFSKGGYEGAGARGSWGRSVVGMQFYDIQEMTSSIYRQQAAMLKRRIDELQGIKAAGGEEAYRAQQAEQVAQIPVIRREGMRAAEQLRIQGGGASSILGGVKSPPARIAQRAAERDRVTVRGETVTSGGGVARRKARRGGSRLLQPTGGAREILG